MILIDEDERTYKVNGGTKFRITYNEALTMDGGGVGCYKLEICKFSGSASLKILEEWTPLRDSLYYEDVEDLFEDIKANYERGEKASWL